MVDVIKSYDVPRAARLYGPIGQAQALRIAVGKGGTANGASVLQFKFL